MITLIIIISIIILFWGIYLFKSDYHKIKPLTIYDADQAFMPKLAVAFDCFHATIVAFSCVTVVKSLIIIGSVIVKIMN